MPVSPSRSGLQPSTCLALHGGRLRAPQPLLVWQLAVVQVHSLDVAPVPASAHHDESSQVLASAICHSGFLTPCGRSSTARAQAAGRRSCWALSRACLKCPYAAVAALSSYCLGCRPKLPSRTWSACSATAVLTRSSAFRRRPRTRWRLRRSSCRRLAMRHAPGQLQRLTLCGRRPRQPCRRPGGAE